MCRERQLTALAHHPPHPRVPEAALRTAITSGAEATQSDGLDRTVVFDPAKRRIHVDTWPADDRADLIHLADITTEAAP